MIKRILLIALLALISISSIFAVNLAKPSADNTYAAMVEPFQPLTARALGMGSAGVAVTGRSDTFYINPASLASKRFQLSLPSAQVTLYHVYDILESGMIENVINGSENIFSGAGSILDSIEAGKGKIADVDAGVSFTAAGFGLGVNARASILTYGDDVGGVNSDIIAKVNAAVSMGYGFRINLPSDFSLDLGLMVRFNYLAYTEKVGAEKVQEVMGNEDPDIMSIFAGIPVMAGFSIPIDVGLNLNMPYGFSLGVVARNLNGKYHMTGFDNYEKFLQDPFGGKVIKDNKFTFDSDWSLDAGIGWSFNRWYFSPTIAVDVRDIVGLAQTKNVDFRDFMYHLNIGAEIRLLSFLDVRGGLSQGYWTLGVGIDLWAIKMDIAYFSQEFGDRVGDNGLDGLTIRFNIGFDR